MNLYEMIRNWFSYHPPQTDDQVATYQQIRNGGKDLAELIARSVPESPEKHIALNKVREAIMWANAGVACHPQEPES